MTLIVVRCRAQHGISTTQKKKVAKAGGFMFVCLVLAFSLSLSLLLIFHSFILMYFNLLNLKPNDGTWSRCQEIRSWSPAWRSSQLEVK